MLHQPKILEDCAWPLLALARAASFLEVDPNFVVGSGTSLKLKESQCVLVVRDSGLASVLKYLLNGLEANCLLYGFAELLVGNLHIARCDGSDKARLGRCDFT
jgi:hypothetical protein